MLAVAHSNESVKFFLEEKLRVLGVSPELVTRLGLNGIRLLADLVKEDRELGTGNFSLLIALERVDLVNHLDEFLRSRLEMGSETSQFVKDNLFRGFGDVHSDVLHVTQGLGQLAAVRVGRGENGLENHARESVALNKEVLGILFHENVEAGLELRLAHDPERREEFGINRFEELLFLL